jgi:energy-converting hydrogenase Eha subunit C
MELQMRTHLIEATVVAAGAFAIVAALHHSPVLDLIYESAISGGKISAGATASLGDVAMNMTASAQ